MSDIKRHPTETPEYWREWARVERKFAMQERARRLSTVESIRTHERNAVEYEAWARKLEADEEEGHV